MSAYLNSLRAGADAAAQAHRQESERVAAEAARARLVPLEVRLGRLLATIPIDVQREGLSLPALRSSLRGRWRGVCHPGELGDALRELGFRRRRQWRGGAGFQALWYPIHRGNG
jgi:hypothetical protein